MAKSITLTLKIAFIFEFYRLCQCLFHTRKNFPIPIAIQLKIASAVTVVAYANENLIIFELSLSLRIYNGIQLYQPIMPEYDTKERK